MFAIRSTRRAKIVEVTVGTLLVIFVLQAGVAALDDSVTVDEFVHLPVGLYMIRHHDFTPDPINPPLSRIAPALVIAPDRTVVEPSFNANPWAMGLDFMDRNVDAYQQIFVRARCVVILMATLLGLLIYRWSSELYGPGAALAAMLLFTFSPSFLAHGHLVTVDIAGALGLTATFYAWWRYLQDRSIGQALIVGLVLGLAILAKLSSLLAVAVMLACALVEIVRPERPDRLRLTASLLLGFLAIGAAAVIVVDAGYGFDRVGERLGEVSFRGGGALAALGARFPSLRLPLPATFLAGADLAMTGRDSDRAAYYLAGSFSDDGWWYYHLVAFALKTPLPIVIGGGIAVGAWLAGRRRARREYCLFVAVLAVFVVNGAFNRLNIGVRHVLAAESLLLVLVAPLFASPIAAFLSSPARPAATLRAVASAVALAWTVSGAARVAPLYLEYFNEAAGDSAGGHRWLLDSNLDWGQDLVRLARYLREKRLESVHLAYMGTVHPWLYGIRFTPLTPWSHGIAVISASTLMGSTYAIWADTRRHVKPEPGSFDWLRSATPIGRIGSLFVYDLP